MHPRSLFPRAVCCFLCATGASAQSTATTSKTPPGTGSSSVLMTTMATELNRAMSSLGKGAAASEHPPYFISYDAHDVSSFSVLAEQGAIMNSNTDHRRRADIIVRVGDPKLDNTHGKNRATALRSIELPLGDDPQAIARALWWGTGSEYRTALQTYLSAKTQTAVRATEADASADFSTQQPVKADLPAVTPPAIDRTQWEQRMRGLSAIFRQHPRIDTNLALLNITTEDNVFVSSEGSAVAYPHQVRRVVVLASTRADDGMDIFLVRTFEADTAHGLPGQASLEKKVEELAGQLDKLRSAPAAEPFDGPAMLSGRAAAVFFHEVLGHRLEGQRQRGDQEGQTFTKDIGKPILPTFLSVVDDPTLATFEGTTLSGHYVYDEEGQRAQRVELVKDGVLENFLMSRMPIASFDASNGHGRAQDGKMPVGRQGNLIVTSNAGVSDKCLREMLIDEIKKQKKPYGLYFDDIASGSTLTQRGAAQTFQVIPMIVYRVYADGRPDELIRGATIVGTPIAALTRILATGDKDGVFNGECGAESGTVPVSAIAPAMLLSEIETQKAAQGNSRPPILPPPGSSSASDRPEASSNAAKGVR